eukprot:10717545-Alexandrium_andersonii.AAC.1
MLQTGHSPRILRAAGRVDQVFRGSISKRLRNTTGISTTSVSLFHRPLRDGGFGCPELQVLAAPAHLGSWARVSATVAEAVGWGTLGPSSPETLGTTSYRAAWDNLRSYGLDEWNTGELAQAPAPKAQASLARTKNKQRLAWVINNTSQAERSLKADLAIPGSA